MARGICLLWRKAAATTNDTALPTSTAGNAVAEPPAMATPTITAPTAKQAFRMTRTKAIAVTRCPSLVASPTGACSIGEADRSAMTMRLANTTTWTKSVTNA